MTIPTLRTRDPGCGCAACDVQTFASVFEIAIRFPNEAYTSALPGVTKVLALQYIRQQIDVALFTLQMDQSKCQRGLILTSRGVGPNANYSLTFPRIIAKLLEKPYIASNTHEKTVSLVDNQLPQVIAGESRIATK